MAADPSTAEKSNRVYFDPTTLKAWFTLQVFWIVRAVQKNPKDTDSSLRHLCLGLSE